MKISNSVLIILPFLFFSCGPSDTDWDDLGDGYFYTEYESVIPSQGYYDTHVYSKVLGYSFNDRYIIIKQKPNLEKYRNEVTQDLSSRIGIYDNFINGRFTKSDQKNTTPFIERSIKADSILYKKLSKLGVTAKNEESDLIKIRLFVDSLFQYNPFYRKVLISKINYWVIDKDNNVRFGPFNKLEFEKKLKSDKIDLNLH